MSIFERIKTWFAGTSPPEPAAQEPARPSDTTPELVTAAPRPKRPRNAPPDDVRVEQAGRALFAAEKPDEAITFLSEHGILFARHEVTSLPCLCRRCLRPELSTAESSGVAYVRDFVVTQYRVFFYWMPAELVADEKHVRASMRAELRQRLRAVTPTERVAGLDPFTGAAVTPRRGDRRINPFTGKPVL